MPTSPSSSVQEARRALASRLRAMREEAELTAIELARLAGWERTKISKIEHLARSPSLADIRTWCRLCRAEDQTDDLLAALRAVTGMYQEWKRLQRTGLRRLQEQRTAVFEQTQEFRSYASQVIPGLLQTPEYATAILSAVAVRNKLPNDVEAAVAARMKRARLLREGGHRFAFILEESVLRYQIGGPTVMAGQLGYLLMVMALPSVSLMVIPFSRARKTHALGNFNIYDQAEVRIELLTAAINVTVPSEIDQYRREFELLASMAVTGSEARSVIAKALADMQ
ncbi:helix-turn-helix domain-containing protein [Nonomuraea endophytica]|uniref:helix-turn-helix domain-containing protein n=1 Tax=Nonomuraea endophytica TaxID=714136 RepID=UPI00161E8386|nr:helix-turn-helix transcriptional regulator [Nonomuraea endophytica]